MKRFIPSAVLTFALLLGILTPCATAGFTPTQPSPPPTTAPVPETPSVTPQPTTPTPAVPATPEIPPVPMAYASTQSVDIDGTAVTFQMYALKDENGNPTNYVKLRDIASALNGSTVQFNVGWDGNVNIEAKRAYVSNGTEMYTPYSGDRPYTVATATTNINGTATALDAIYLTDDSGGGYTYYQLRDLGAALGFTVGWTSERGVYVETPKPYMTTTLTRVVLADPAAQITMDNTKRVIYYDATKNSVLALDPLTGQTSTILNAATTAYNDGLNSYQGLTVKQVFWDSTANRLIIGGAFGSSADGWTVGDGVCEGLFLLENSSLTKLCDWPDFYDYYPFTRLGAVLGNGNFVGLYGYGSTNDGRNAFLVDPYSEPERKPTWLDNHVDPGAYFFSVGSTLYRAGSTDEWAANLSEIPATLCRRDFSTNTWVGVGDPAIGASYYDGEYLHSWAKDGVITAIRPSDGAYQPRLALAKEVEARDALPIPSQPDRLFFVGDNQYVFYDGASSAIRMIVSNPDLAE